MSKQINSPNGVERFTTFTPALFWASTSCSFVNWPDTADPNSTAVNPAAMLAEIDSCNLQRARQNDSWLALYKTKMTGGLQLARHLICNLQAVRQNMT